jgi:hypothetical protein
MPGALGPPPLTRVVGSNGSRHMKFTNSALTASSLLAASLLALCGCVEPKTAQVPALGQSGHRLIRISFSSRSGDFRMRISGGPVETFADTSFTNTMIGLRLGYGDIAIWEAVRDERGEELIWSAGISAWWGSHLRGARASFYGMNSDSVSDFFTAPIYHATGPPDKPRPLTSAVFYTDGESLGTGAVGFRAMLRAMQAQKSGWVFLLAPRIKNEGQESPWSQDDQELAWAKQAGVLDQFERVEYGQRGGLTDFARLADDQ